MQPLGADHLAVSIVHRRVAPSYTALQHVVLRERSLRADQSRHARSLIASLLTVRACMHRRRADAVVKMIAKTGAVVKSFAQ